jgi:hypothetical protein
MADLKGNFWNHVQGKGVRDLWMKCLFQKTIEKQQKCLVPYLKPLNISDTNIYF